MTTAVQDGGMCPTLETRRLQLRAWRARDLAAFATLNADARVMEFLPGPLDRAESDALAWRIRDHFTRHGFGLWAVEAPGVSDFIGFVGLSVPSFQAPFMPCVEIGWRLAYEYRGHGYATEAAIAALAFGFRDLALDEIVSFTVPLNVRSRRAVTGGHPGLDPRADRWYIPLHLAAGDGLVLSDLLLSAGWRRG